MTSQRTNYIQKDFSKGATLENWSTMSDSIIFLQTKQTLKNLFGKILQITFQIHDPLSQFFYNKNIVYL